RTGHAPARDPAPARRRPGLLPGADSRIERAAVGRRRQGVARHPAGDARTGTRRGQWRPAGAARRHARGAAGGARAAGGAGCGDRPAGGAGRIGP
nr:hypothetical protein [Tanacetum cinerariifolium]